MRCSPLADCSEHNPHPHPHRHPHLTSAPPHSHLQALGSHKEHHGEQTRRSLGWLLYLSDDGWGDS
jgi:hypothetical protein